VASWGGAFGRLPNPLRMRRRRPLAIALALCATGAVAVPAWIALGAPGDQLPDLVADPPEDPYLEVYGGTGTDRLLLRFDGFVHNAGAGALEMLGGNRSGTAMSLVRQRIRLSAGGTRMQTSGARILYEPQDGHEHWHLKDAARYSLWNSARTAEVAPGQKVGFCLEDVDELDSSLPPVFTDDAIGFCSADGYDGGGPNATSVRMGVTAGWRDVYHSGIAFQWVDVSDVPPGQYWLGAEVDPDNLILESSESNARAFAPEPSIVPGWVAQPLGAPDLPSGRPSALSLSATKVEGTTSEESAGDVRYRVLSPPAHGTLDVPVGRDLASPVVTYTPEPGYGGPDSFTYAAVSSISPFPLTPVAATASLVVGAPAPAVSLGGVPGELTTGASVQLTASVTGAPAGVSWSVSGAAGGNAQVGTITPAGLYTAPAAVPSGGAVTIRAASVASPGAAAEGRIAIVAPPAARPAPSGLRPAAAKRLPALGRLTVIKRGRALVARVVPGRSGRVTIGARVGRKALGGCSLRGPAGRPMSCRIPLPKTVKAANVRFKVTLWTGRRVVAQRGAKLR
jgi:hypothetical protein